MIVDDDQSQISTIKIGLDHMNANYKIISANNGKQCLEILEKGIIPDLILLDIMMPEMDGWDVAAEIKKNPKWSDIPFIFVTAKTDPFSKKFGGLVSMAYITKPIEIKNLKEKVDSILNEL